MASSSYRFASFRLDPACRVLWRGDEEVQLPPKAFDCLAYLIEHRDRAVGREELIDAVWGKANLAGSVLGQAIATARRALEDTGEEHEYIKTVRRFGYRWAAPVETVDAEGAADVHRGRGPMWFWPSLAVVALGVLTLATAFLWRGGEPGGLAAAAWQMEEGEIVLLLPVTVEPSEHHSWVRFGVMELIAERLRAAGQPMVPSETAIALAGDFSDAPGAQQMHALSSTTGARLVLGAHATTDGSTWRVSVHSLGEAAEPLSAMAEDDDVLEAARLAADRLALSLGLTPAPEPDAEPGLAMLLRQIDAAILAQRTDVARELVEAARPELRRRPEVRFQAARIDYYGQRLDDAKTALEALLDETTAERNRVLRARILNGLSGVYLWQDDFDAAEATLLEAARLLEGEVASSHAGTVQTNLGVLARRRDDFEAGRLHLAQARRIFAGVGDIRGLADLDDTLGVQQLHVERYADALPHLQSAAERHAALHSLGGELRARANLIHTHLGLLDPRAAAAIEPRLSELLTQVPHVALRLHAEINKVYLLEEMGQLGAAGSLLAEILATSEQSELPPMHRLAAQLLAAEWLDHTSPPAQAASLAGELVAKLDDHPSMYEERARAWWILVRAWLALDAPSAAAEEASAMRSWAERGQAASPRIYASIARAEIAAAEGRADAAREAFDDALALADAGQVPLRRLQVARSYVPWLLDREAHGTPDVERALVVADRVMRYADRHYGAALLQLRVYHALGPPSAWRTALAQARRLAGEREIPPELLAAP